MPIPADEYPLHQAPYSLAHAATSDRNFYDRCYLNCFDTEGDFLLISGLGQYPNLGTTDAFVCVRIGDHQHVVRTSDALGPDRMRQEVGPYRLEVVDPLPELHLTCAGDEWGVAVDLHWRGSFPAVDESPHLMRTGAKLTLDAQRFAQVGTWEGQPEAARREKDGELPRIVTARAIEKGADAGEQGEGRRAEMGDEACEKEKRVGAGKVRRAEAQGVRIEKIPAVVKHHDDHDQAPPEARKTFPARRR